MMLSELDQIEMVPQGIHQLFLKRTSKSVLPAESFEVTSKKNSRFDNLLIFLGWLKRSDNILSIEF